MPKFAGRKLATRASLDHLDIAIETSLTHGSFFGLGGELTTIAEFRQHWDRWGEEITDRWRRAFAGSRPMALYLLRELPPPPMDGVPDDDIFWLDVGGCERINTRWHCDVIELEHLKKLGILAKEEITEARRRFRDDYPMAGSRYERISA